MARRRRHRKLSPIPFPTSMPRKKIPRDFFSSGSEFTQYLIDNMRPGYKCRVTNAGKLFLGPYKRR